MIFIIIIIFFPIQRMLAARDLCEELRTQCSLVSLSVESQPPRLVMFGKQPDLDKALKVWPFYFQRIERKFCRATAALCPPNRRSFRRASERWAMEQLRQRRESVQPVDLLQETFTVR